jgi:hypothetical protein
VDCLIAVYAPLERVAWIFAPSWQIPSGAVLHVLMLFRLLENWSVSTAFFVRARISFG